MAPIPIFTREDTSLITIFYIILSALLITVDQYSKHLAVTYLANGKTVDILPEIFELRYLENHGVAFGMMQDMRWIFIPISIVLTAVLVWLLARSPLRQSGLFRFSCYLCLAGALGNMIDRFALGYVIDFLYFKLIDFPIFNLADCYVVIATFLLAYFVLFRFKKYDDLSMRAILGFTVKKEKHNG